ncbi:Abi family protein [Shewanella sp. 0m-11]
MPINSIIKTLSATRLSTYKKQNLCDASDEQSLGLYLWNKQLSGHFFPILQILEVSLRNAIYSAYIEDKEQQIEANFPQAQWQAQKQQIDYLWFTNIYNPQNNFRGFKQVDTAKNQLIKEQKPLTSDNYISKLMFGFWVNMTNQKHRSSTTPGSQPIIELWPRLTQKVFPNALDKHGNRLSINHISSKIQDINKLRNRIAHHEPIWKATDLFDTDDAINNVVMHYDLCLRVIDWINPDNHKLLSIIENDKLMGATCSQHTLWRNKQLPTGLESVPKLGYWLQAHKIETRRNGVVIHSTDDMALIRCNESNQTFYTNKSKQTRKTSWPLPLNTIVSFIPKPSSTRHPTAIKVKQ